uniref:Uncharacterized protein n=1 Tax=Siphoviridae sp. ctoic9 TaxID=2825671 RepID=A0A8S5Q9W2_9CAUD|nr:MAG TPA: hypothetical protein [Siphoviridae sp. ctoic9]
MNVLIWTSWYCPRLDYTAKVGTIIPISKSYR